MPSKYKIYELSARAVISFAEEENGIYRFHLSRAATKKCFAAGASHEQDDNALFYQTMCVLHGDNFTMPKREKVISDLCSVIIYMNFSGIFDRNGAQKKYGLHQQKARDLFRPEGIGLDFGDGERRYLAFERSASMSRNAQLTFIRADFYETVRRRIMLDIHIGRCQLSKLYAYNGLMLSGGVRVDGVGIDKPGRVIVIENEKRIARQTKVVTVVDDGTQNSTRKYHREERMEDIEVLCFDGEGLISKEYAPVIDCAYCGDAVHSSFQIRLPYVKGMLHQVDFRDFLMSAGTTTITDSWGVIHNVTDVDIILTKSMFKGFGWLKDDGKTWEDYWDAFRRYRHALYITGASKEKPEATTELNYQFLNTVSIKAEEFRPADLPDGWDHSPEEDSRLWLTKQTETEYYNLCANEQYRRDYFLKALERRGFWMHKKDRDYYLAAVLKKNPLFISEPVYADELDAKAEKILEQYSIGHLIIAGDNRYLSGDLLDFLTLLLSSNIDISKRQHTFWAQAITNRFPETAFFAPGAAYPIDGTGTLLRNPHIAKNEELQLIPYTEKNNMRKHYLGHLRDVVMVDAFMLASERLGGADYDGDMIKTISDPLLNKCVRRNYGIEELSSYFTQHGIDNLSNIPLLHIPAAKPRIRDANDWNARFETVSSTFSSRVGQICNAALDRSVIAYNENSSADERARYREETETLAILTGLEIDSAKSGVRPDLDEYLGRGKVPRSPFLRYKTLVEGKETKRDRDEPSRKQKTEAFFKKYNWSEMSSNLERLPYLARQLKKHTPKIKNKPAADKKLFKFAQDEHWKDALDADVLTAVAALLKDYEACLSRIRACRAPIAAKPRESDIDRILYSRGQEGDVDPDELYALFQTFDPERISALRHALSEQSWYFTRENERESLLMEWMPELAEWYDLFSDFRCGGAKLLGDLVCDVDDENAAYERKALFRETDSPAFSAMMKAYADKSFSKYYREAVAEECRAQLDKIVKPVLAVRYVAALGKRKLLFELLYDAMEKNVLEVRHAQ